MGNHCLTVKALERLKGSPDDLALVYNALLIKLKEENIKKKVLPVLLRKK